MKSWGLKATDDGGVIVVAGTGDEYEEYSECNGDDCSIKLESLRHQIR